MFLRLTILPALAFVSVTAAATGPDARLSVEAPPAIVQVRPQSEGRRLVRLPGLEYELDVEAYCGEGAESQSVSISVNDTRLTLDSQQLAERAGSTIRLAVPARQVAPVAIDGFCKIDDETTQQGGLLIRDAVTAHASLRCSNEETEWITYASRGLDVTLQCDVPETNQSVTETDR